MADAITPAPVASTAGSSANTSAPAPKAKRPRSSTAPSACTARPTAANAPSAPTTSASSKPTCSSSTTSATPSPAPSSKPTATTSTPAASGGAAESPINLPAPTPEVIIKDLDRWTTRAKKGDKVAQQQLRQLLDRPDCFRLFYTLTDRVRTALTRDFTRDNWFSQRLIWRELREIHDQLLGPNPSAVERLLAERVAIGWLEVHVAEYRLIHADGDWREHWQKQVYHAHRRFLSALRMLTSVRQLPRPAVQVNIGDQQVNVCGLPPPCDTRPPRG